MKVIYAIFSFIVNPLAFLNFMVWLNNAANNHGVYWKTNMIALAFVWGFFVIACVAFTGDALDD